MSEHTYRNYFVTKDMFTMTSPQHTTVWAELPVTDLDKGIAFYSAVTGLEINKTDMDGNVMGMFKVSDDMTGVAGHLYQGKPAGDGSGPTVHLLAMGKLEEVMQRVTKAGGDVVSEPIAIPAGRFFYAKDPDGNSIGLFEAS